MSDTENDQGLISLDLTAMFTDPKTQKWVKRLEKPIKILTKISTVEVYQNRVLQDASPVSNWEKWLKHLQVQFQQNDNSVGKIPESAPILILSNHPFGMIDGFALMAMVKTIRSDVKIMTNQSLQTTTGLGEDIIGVNPYGQNSSKKANLAPIRTALHWLKQGGALIIFPSGDVSVFDRDKNCVEDPEWNPLIGRIALKSKADIIPIHIMGQNSKLFHQLRRINERLASFMLARECLKKRGNTIYYTIGNKIPYSNLETMQDAKAVINYARTKVYELVDRSAKYVGNDEITTN